jgi:hypothetical protein
MGMYNLHIRSSTARQKECEDAIMDYLVKNKQKHIHKEEVIKAVTDKGKGSRVTIREALKRLHRLHIINIDKEKENSQTHWVSINSDSEMRRIMESIQYIRNAFFELLEKASTLPKEDERGLRYREVNAAENAIITLFEHLVGIFMLYFLLEWPKKVPDVITRSELYTLTFQKIHEIQIRLLEVFPHPDQATNIRDKIVEDLFILKGGVWESELYPSVEALGYVGFGKQTEPLVDQLLEFGLPFVNTFGDEFKDASDWRNVIAVRQKELDRREKAALRIVRNFRNAENKSHGFADSHSHPQEKGRRSPRRKHLT